MPRASWPQSGRIAIIDLVNEMKNPHVHFKTMTDSIDTKTPSSTPSFTSCGQAASGDCYHANFPLVARSTVTFEPGRTPVCGSIYIRAGPSSCRTRSLSFGGDHGWAIGQDKRAWWCSWFRRTQAGQGTQTAHLGRHSWAACCQSCRVGSLPLGRLKCVVYEDPDGNSRCRPRKPQAGSNPEAKPRMAATNRQEATTSVQDHGSDMDRGT